MSGFVVLLMGLTASAIATSQALPGVELTRYVSPMGIEHLTLRCQADRTAREGYSCELLQQRNGLILVRAMVPPKTVDTILRRYFRRVPKERIEPAGSAFQGEARARTDLHWSVNHGGFVSRGSVTRGLPRDMGATIAIISLENELGAYLLR